MSDVSRRELLGAAALTAAGAALPGLAGAQGARPSPARLKQSVCAWCFGGMTLDVAGSGFSGAATVPDCH